MGIKVSKLKKRWMKDPAFKKEYDDLEQEFALASMLIAARTNAKLSQGQLAEKMGTSQSTVARLESGDASPSLSTLQRFAEATDTRIQLKLVPKNSRRKKPGRAA